MERSELSELHYITPVQNVPSILEHGVLSHVAARSLPHQSIAKQEVQDLRAKVEVSGGGNLHSYANLYLHARNPMMYLRRARHTELTVVRVSPAVLDLPGVIVADQNAASGRARFSPAPDGLRYIDRELAFAEVWTSPDQYEYWRRKSARCAEVLVPDRVPPEFVSGFYVSGEFCQAVLSSMQSGSLDQIGGVNIIVEPHLFFAD